MQRELNYIDAADNSFGMFASLIAMLVSSLCLPRRTDPLLFDVVVLNVFPCF